MVINLYQVPYDTGRRSWRMGRGPEYFIRNGLEAYLRARGHLIEFDAVDTVDPFPAEIHTGFELNARLARLVRQGCIEKRFPVVLGGNCSDTIGLLSGIPEQSLGVVWFDAHGDFNTPETTVSGYLDGMGLAIAAGLCWKTMASRIPNFRPIAGERILHLGARDIEPEEALTLARAGVTVIPAEQMASGDPAALSQALDALRAKVDHLVIHIDLDVLDPARYPANHFPGAGGLDVETVKSAIRQLRQRFTISGLSVASFDPSFDAHGATLRAGVELIDAVVS
jgi:arginase